MKNTEKQIAVLIDAENVSYKLVDEIFEEIALLGRVTHRRVYGDFSTQAMSGWNAVSNDFALRQVQQQHSKNGKNSSDIVLVIDAMDILHAGKVDAICVVSNDNDFTRLAIRLVEGGLEVIGMGEMKKAGQSFVSACTTFKYITDKNDGVKITDAKSGDATGHQPQTSKSDDLSDGTPCAPSTPPPDRVNKSSPDASKDASAATQVKSQDVSEPPTPLPLSKKNVTTVIKHALANLEADSDGWVFIGTLGSVLHNRWPNFDPRAVKGVTAKGKQLSAFLKELPAFEMTVRNKQHYLRLKQP